MDYQRQQLHFNGLMQKRHNFSALAMELLTVQLIYIRPWNVIFAKQNT